MAVFGIVQTPVWTFIRFEGTKLQLTTIRLVLDAAGGRRYNILAQRWREISAHIVFTNFPQKAQRWHSQQLPKSASARLTLFFVLLIGNTELRL